MKLKYIVIIVFLLSVVSLSLSMGILLKSILEAGPPSGVQQIELFNGASKQVAINSEEHSFSLYYLRAYDNSCEIKVSLGFRHQLRSVYLDEETIFYDSFGVTLKEIKSDSVILWIQKEEG